MKRLISLICNGTLLFAIAGTGCSSRLVFLTKTSIGLEASGTAQMPDKVSFSFSRYEGAVVPRSTNGDPYSVYGGLDADVKWFPPVYTIRQTFATGRAAQLAAGAQETSDAGSIAASGKPLFFVTDTSFGLKISAGKQDVSPTLLLGYKRAEGTVIPLEKGEKEARSVYADIIINSSSVATGITTNFPNNNGVRIRQSFATGKAADAAVQIPEIKSSLDKMAAAGAVGQQSDAAIHDETILQQVFDRLQLAANSGDKAAASQLAALNQLVSLVPDSYIQFKSPPPGAAPTRLQTRMQPFDSSKGYLALIEYRRLLISNLNLLDSELKKALPAEDKFELQNNRTAIAADLKKLNEAVSRTGAERDAIHFYTNHLI